MPRLIPMDFPQKTTVFKTPLKTPAGSPINIPMNVSPENGGYISRWSPTWKDRFLMFFCPKRCVWLVVYGVSHPPVYLVCANSVFTKDKEG